jgi:hypothetical protein
MNVQVTQLPFCRKCLQTDPSAVRLTFYT